jgi:5-methylthioadenosine/S-adenosylhomocysteine deaminase
VQKWKGHELIVPAVAPHAPYTVSEEHLKAIRAFSIAPARPSSPISRKPKEKSTTASRRRAQVRRLSGSHRLPNDRVIGAHLVWPSDEEIQILKREGVGGLTIRSQT